MLNTQILLPSKPEMISHEGNKATFEIVGLYPGYGHTLGNSLRRIILSSIEGVAITSIKIAGVMHEFSTISGVKEDVISIILNLKKINFSLISGEEKVINLKVKGIKEITAKDIELPGQVTIANTDQYIASITDKNAELDMEITIKKGIGYLPKEIHQKDKVDIGTIAMDAVFSPVILVNYDVQMMRVGDRTDFNKLSITIETNGSVTPKESLETSINIMIDQLHAIIGFKSDLKKEELKDDSFESDSTHPNMSKEDLDDILKTRIESLDLTSRTKNALIDANIRTVGGLIRKKEQDILDIDGIAEKGLEEVKEILNKIDLQLKA